MYNNNWNTSWNYRKSNKGVLVKYSAGILPYSFNQDGKLFFLLGKDHENDWSDFGGRCEFKDNGSPVNTASREFYEESLGAVMSISDTISKLNNIPESLKIVSKTLNGSPYYMYLVYVDYLNYSESFSKTNNFINYSLEKTQINKLVEKNAIRWFSIDTLLNCIENESNCILLRGVFYRTISEFKESLVFLNRN